MKLYIVTGISFPLRIGQKIFFLPPDKSQRTVMSLLRWNCLEKAASERLAIFQSPSSKGYLSSCSVSIPCAPLPCLTWPDGAVPHSCAAARPPKKSKPLRASGFPFQEEMSPVIFWDIHCRLMIRLLKYFKSLPLGTGLLSSNEYYTHGEMALGGFAGAITWI